MSLLMDISSELIPSLLPMLTFSMLGVSLLSMPISKGIAETKSLLTKTFPGVLSNYWAKRKGE